jgi:class 3 adenylate cyclase
VGETRKLAAILAADVVGYSRLMGEDEAGTAKIVRERREAQHQSCALSAGGWSRRLATAFCSNSLPSLRRSNARSPSRR